MKSRLTVFLTILAFFPGGLLHAQPKSGSVDFEKIPNLKCETYTGQTRTLCEKEVRRRTNKRVLYLRGARYTNSSVSQVKIYPNLTSLVLAYSRVNNQGLGQLAGHPSLVYLNLTSTPIHNGAFRTLNRVPKLSMLDIAHTGIDEKGLFVLKRDWLSRLDISHTKISKEGIKKIPEYFPSLKRLEMMALPVDDEILLSLIGVSREQYNKYKEEQGGITGSITGLLGPEEDRIDLENEGLKELEDLNLAGTEMSNEGVAILSAIEGLKLLNLSYTMIDDDGLKHIPRNRSLEVLSLSGTRITDRSIDNLMYLSDLKVLSLENTEVTDDSLETLAKHDSLKSLYLKGSKVTMEGMKKIAEKNSDLVIHHPDFAEERAGEDDDEQID